MATNLQSSEAVLSLAGTQGTTGFDPVSGEVNDSLAGDFLWSNVNFGEAVPEVMTPLAWAVLQFTLADWVFLPGYSTVGNIGGRPYLNISVFASLLPGPW